MCSACQFWQNLRLNYLPYIVLSHNQIEAWHWTTSTYPASIIAYLYMTEIPKTLGNDSFNWIVFQVCQISTALFTKKKKTVTLYSPPTPQAPMQLHCLYCLYLRLWPGMRTGWRLCPLSASLLWELLWKTTLPWSSAVRWAVVEDKKYWAFLHGYINVH